MDMYDLNEIKDILFYIKRGNFSRAQLKLNNYKKKYPKDSKNIGLQVKLYNEMHNYIKAYEFGVKYLNNNFKERYSYTLYIREFAVTLIYLKKYNQAAGLLTEAIKITEGNVPKLIKQLADIYIIQNNYQKALELYDMYTKPENETFLNLNKLKALYTIGKYDECIKLASEIYDINLDDYQVQKKYYYVGESYFRLGDYNTAIFSLKKALTIDSAFHQKAKKAIKRIEEMAELNKDNGTEKIIDFNQNKKTLIKKDNNDQK